MVDCNVWNLMREHCNEECEEWLKCPLANILREGKQIAEEKEELGRKETSGSDPSLIERLIKGQSLFGAVAFLGLAIYTAFSSVEYISSINSWENLFWSVMWMFYVFVCLYWFSGSVKNYTLWDAKEKRILKVNQE